MTESEANIKRAIRDYLELKKCVVVPVRNVGIMKPNGQYIPLPAGDRGMSDLIGCLPSGRFFAIEVIRFKRAVEQALLLRVPQPETPPYCFLRNLLNTRYLIV